MAFSHVLVCGPKSKTRAKFTQDTVWPGDTDNRLSHPYIITARAAAADSDVL